MKLLPCHRSHFLSLQGFGMATIAPLVAMAGFPICYDMKSGEQIKKKVQWQVDCEENELVCDKISKLLTTFSICRQNFINQFVVVTTTRITPNLFEINVQLGQFKIGNIPYKKTIPIGYLKRISDKLTCDCMTETTFFKMINNCQVLTRSLCSLITNVLGFVQLNNADPTSPKHKISLNSFSKSESEQIKSL
jgi:hypothetical protein